MYTHIIHVHTQTHRRNTYTYIHTHSQTDIEAHTQQWKFLLWPFKYRNIMQTLGPSKLLPMLGADKGPGSWASAFHPIPQSPWGRH